MPIILTLCTSWYLYYTAGSSDTLDNQRVHVLEGKYPVSTSLWSATNNYIQAVLPLGTHTAIWAR